MRLLFNYVLGEFPEELMVAWDDFRVQKKTLALNDSPREYPNQDKIHYLLIGLANGGNDMESILKLKQREQWIRSADHLKSIMAQVALNLIVAEDVAQFEHRDLHIGNILLKKVPVDTILSFKRDGTTISVPTNGLLVTIIDFTLSRISSGLSVVYTDLSEDVDQFNQPKEGEEGYDPQYDVYREIKDENK